MTHIDAAQQKTDLALLREMLSGEVQNTAQRFTQESAKTEQLVRNVAVETQAGLRTVTDSCREECEWAKQFSQEQVAEVHKKWARHSELALAKLEELTGNANQDR